MNESEIFQHYQVLRREDGSVWELGRGSMGVTYKAFDTDLHCEVALKVILPQILHNEDSKGRFLREARLAARLRHPNIAAIFHLGRTADETYFYAMEFCEGETLQHIVEKRGPFDVAAALAIVLQISRALVLANKHQLVHRDIKPANLILTDSPTDGPTVKIIDFGLAKSYLAEGSTWASMGTSGFVGTAHFASPEQLENEPVDGRSDIYSLGVTLWFLITGKSIFGGSLARIVSQHLSAPVPWPELEGRNVPPSVRTLLARMLEKKPVDRFPNALELKNAVEECLAVMAGGAVTVPTGGLLDVPVSGGASVVLAERWQLMEKCGSGETNQLFRALDLRQQGKPVAVKILDGRIAADPEICQRLDRTVNILCAAPHANLVQPLAFGKDGAGDRFLAMEWIEGFTLLAVLRARGAMTMHDALRLLKPMASGFDHARRHGLTRLEWSAHQILIHFPEGFDDEQRRERTLHLPLDTWPPFRVTLGTLPLERPAADDDDTLVGKRTRLHVPEEAGVPAASGDAPAASLEVSALGRLIYELLGGTPAVIELGLATGSARYVPLSQATEAGNAVLRRAVLPAADDPGFATAQEFYEALENTVEPAMLRPTTTRQGLPVPLAAAPAGVAEKRAPSGKRWPWLVVPVLLAVVGPAAYFGLSRSSPPAKVRKLLPLPTASPSPPISAQHESPTVVDEVPPTPAASTPQPTAVTTQLPPDAAEPSPPMQNPEAASPAEVIEAMPTLVAATPVPLPPLEGKLEHVELSPLRDLRLEYRRIGAQTSIWLIPQADESRRRLLYKFQRNAQVLFSPDEKSLLISDHPNGDGGGAQLYRRTRADEFLYEVPEELQRSSARIDDLAWRFYLREVGLPPNASRDHVRIDGANWQADSSAFMLRFTSSGPGETNTVPVPWLCRYDLASRRFEAVTDVHAARNAIAARAKEKVPPTAGTPTPPPRPAGDWQKSLGEFINGFVRCDQTRDVSAALAYYAPVVDYYGEGRVSQAYIRSDILKYDQRWPVQRNRVVGNPDLREIKPGQSYSARFHMTFSVENATRKAWSHGESALEMSIEMVRGVPMIVSIREKTVHREKGTLSGR